MSESAIKVAIRVRPCLREESLTDDRPIKIKAGTQIEIRNSLFSFDAVFTPDVSTQAVYKELVSDKIKHLMDGYNVTILAYGATGSGKTFTMGTALNAESLGLIHLGLKEIFEYIESTSQETVTVAKVSFFEIHMEEVRDLLKNELCFVSGDSKEAKLSNMTQIYVPNYCEAIKALRKGCQARITAATSKNTRSSRSHAFYIISLVFTDRKTGISKFSKFQLVDLAGSERSGTDTSGKEFKQGVLINKGLTALGRVISSLSNREKHIPYRDSVLTKYLQDSFGGNSYTVMVTCINPAQVNIEETLSSLRYTSFAKNIKNLVMVNKDKTHFSEHLISKLDNTMKEKQNLVNEKNHLNDCLKKAERSMEKCKGKVLEFSNSFQSLEEMMLMETYKNPLLQPYIEVVRKIKKNINNFAIELEPVCSTMDEDASSCEKINEYLNISSSMEAYSITRNYKLDIEGLDYLSKMKLIEMEIRNYENLKTLYDPLQCEENHNISTNKLEGLLKKRDKLCTAFSKVGFSSDEIANEIQSMEKELQDCQQKNKICALTLIKKNSILKHYDNLKQSLKDLEKQNNANFPNKLLQLPAILSDVQQSTSESVIISKLEEEAQKINNLFNSLTDHYKTYLSMTITELPIGDESLFYVEKTRQAKVDAKMLEYEIKKFQENFEKKLDNKEPILQDIQEEHSRLNSIREAYEKRIIDWKHRLNNFNEEYNFKSALLNENTARFLLDYLFIKVTSLDADTKRMISIYENISQSNKNICKPDRLKFLDQELNKLKSEKQALDVFLKKQLLDLNYEWESKIFVLLKNASKNMEILQSGPPNLPMEVKTLELKNKQNEDFQKKFYQGSATLDKKAYQSTSENMICSKLEEEAQTIEQLISTHIDNYGINQSEDIIAELDIGDESTFYFNRCMNARTSANVLEYEIKRFEENFKKETDNYKLWIDKEPTLEEVQNKHAGINSIHATYEKRIINWKHSLEHFKDQHCLKSQLLMEDTAKFLLDFTFTSATQVETDHVVMMYRFENISSSAKHVDESDRIKFLEMELIKLRSEKYALEAFLKKEVCDLNSEWESKILNLMKNGCGNTEILKSGPPNLPIDITTSLENLWSRRNLKSEDNCKELKKKNFDDTETSMIEAFLSDEENQKSELLDQDYHATPKRKFPEDFLTSPKRSKVEDKTDH